MLPIIKIATALLLSIGGIALVYYLSLAIVSYLSNRSGLSQKTVRYSSFAVVIPAHNEERLLLDTLRSCDALQYPTDKFTVYVIADNCTDNTAEIARQHGSTCLPRNDATLLGKGHALAFAFEQIPAEVYDAVVVLDADCRIAPNALTSFNACLIQGQKVLQAKCLAANPDDSPISYALAVGCLIENCLFYIPKSRLGLGVLLRGTGFALHKSVIGTFKWNAHSIAEDIEYSITLTRARLRIRYVADTAVYSVFPASPDQLIVQRTRWAGGNITGGRSKAVSLMAEGIRAGNIPLIDVGFTLLVLSRPLVLFLIFTAAVLAGFVFIEDPTGASGPLATVALVELFGVVLYFGIAIVRLGLTAKRLSYLLKAPSVILMLVAVSLRALIGFRVAGWGRTPR